MFIKVLRKPQRAFTLPEYFIAMTVFAIGAAAVLTLFLFSIRSFASMANYSTLNQENRIVMDKLTREIREAQFVQSYATNPPSLTLMAGDGATITYTFSAVNRCLTRTHSTTGSEILLTNCTVLDFQLYQRNPMGNGLDIYEAVGDVQNNVKAVELTWRTEKLLNPTTMINSENVQTARIVIRKQQNL